MKNTKSQSAAKNTNRRAKDRRVGQAQGPFGGGLTYNLNNGTIDKNSQSYLKVQMGCIRDCLKNIKVWSIYNDDKFCNEIDDLQLSIDILEDLAKEAE